MVFLSAKVLALACIALPLLVAGSINLQQPLLPTSSSPSSSRDQLVRYSYSSRAEVEQAVAWMEEHEVDVWSTTRRDVTARMSAEQVNLRHRVSGATAEVLLPSIQQHLDSYTLNTAFNQLHSTAAVANLSTSRLAAGLHSPIHDSYHSLDSIHQILRSFEEEFPNYAKLVSVGYSAEGKEIWGLKVTNQSYSPSVVQPDEGSYTTYQDSDGVHSSKHKKHKIHKKMGFVVAAGQHAREWIAPSVSLYLIHDLLLSTTLAPTTTSQSTASSLLDTLEFTFIPITNPDGYSHTWSPTGDRLWRKNRQPTGDGCFGVDLNRNWGFHFARGSRPNPCSDAYAGEEAFQAPESKALKEYMLDKKNNVKGFLDVHSFGQMIMFPYSYSCSHSSPDEENHFEGVVWAAKALRAVHGKNFEVGSVCEVSLTAPGESIDWTYAVGKIRWSFAVELRGGIFGFLLPPAQIRPSGEEMSAAFVALADYVVRKESGQRFDVARGE